MGFSLEAAEYIQMEKRMTKRALMTSLLGGLLAASALAACTPTVRVKVDPINIYAKLDADVRVRLDKEVQTLIQQNPNLF
jgi:predicted secreted Zn-dependent protease